MSTENNPYAPEPAYWHEVEELTNALCERFPAEPDVRLGRLLGRLTLVSRAKWRTGARRVEWAASRRRFLGGQRDVSLAFIDGVTIATDPDADLEVRKISFKPDAVVSPDDDNPYGVLDFRLDAGPDYAAAQQRHTEVAQQRSGAALPTRETYEVLLAELRHGVHVATPVAALRAS